MLVGALSGSELVVTAVLVPNQRGSSDMCEMTNEEEIWECVPSYARNRRSCRRENPFHRQDDGKSLPEVPEQQHNSPDQVPRLQIIDICPGINQTCLMVKGQFFFTKLLERE